MSSITKTSQAQHHRRSAAPLNCSIFMTDIVGYSDPFRDDHDRAALRSTLLRILVDGFTASGLTWRRCRHHDRGDGLLTIVPPTLSTYSLINPLLHVLGENILQHNRTAPDELHLQLRSALLVGPVLLGDTGYPNASVIHAARMLDSVALRRTFATSNHAFATMVSSYVYENVVQHTRGAVTASAFHRTSYDASGATFSSWTYVAQTSDDGSQG